MKIYLLLVLNPRIVRLFRSFPWANNNNALTLDSEILEINLINGDGNRKHRKSPPHN